MPDGRTPKVLVVDDEPALRDLLVDVLAGPDLDVATAACGDEAVRLAEEGHVDLVVADLYLGDGNGLDVIDRLRTQRENLPTVVITGSRDVESFTSASRHRPVEVMTKPLDIERLRSTIHQELARQADSQRQSERQDRLRRLAKGANSERRSIRRRLDDTCEDLTQAYRNLSTQLAMQKVVLAYQTQLLSAKNDDDVFRSLFRLFVQRTGPVFGVAMVCDSNAQLNIIGRFGVPYPDSVLFCNALTDPLIEAMLATPQCMLIDAGDEAEMFEGSIRRYLPGVSILAIPLIPGPGELIGLVALYRKGEQPFTEDDIAIAEMVATPTAIAVRRND